MTGLNQDVISKQAKLLAEAGIDATIAMTPENFAYLAGFTIPSHERHRHRYAAVVVTADGRSALLCIDMEETTVRSLVPATDIVVWQEFADNAMQSLAQLLGDLGVSGGTVAVETNYIPAMEFDRLRNHVPNATFLPAQSLFNQARMHKTPREVDLIRDLSRRTDRAIEFALQNIHAGDSEFDLGLAAMEGLYQNGVDQQRGMIVATGPRSQYPNVGPSDRTLEPGDLIRLEVFGISRGYHAGICRSAVVGSADAEALRVWSVLVDCRRIVHKMLNPGASSSEIYRAYVSRFSELGHDPISFVGHGIGVYRHETPYLRARDDVALESGMVLGVEPLLYLPGHFGLQIKDMIHIDDDGPELLSDVMDAETLMVVE
jgi:Xaa-Pro aminopeptidase